MCDQMEVFEHYSHHSVISRTLVVYVTYDWSDDKTNATQRLRVTQLPR